MFETYILPAMMQLRFLQTVLSSLLICSCVVCYGGPCDVYTTLRRHVENQGFHRELHSEVEIIISHMSEWEHCDLLLQDTIPSGLYVDPDQLQSLNQIGVLAAFTPARVDVEQPEHLSDSHTVYTYTGFNKTDNLLMASLTLPFHVRYHKPVFHNSENRGYATVTLGSPTLLLKCSEMNMENECADELVHAPCDRAATKQCLWLNLSYKSNTLTHTLLVPVGNLEHQFLVTSVSLLVTFGSCVYLLFALWKTSNR